MTIFTNDPVLYCAIKVILSMVVTNTRSKNCPDEKPQPLDMVLQSCSLHFGQL